ncbi:MAG TPA: chalcone isomerase family protein [Candidatus Margulisiibacteriota bacterium]|nr:chalcone isomerase family protein [Candidatus Margulisiibacteriota bacterium]
MNRTSVTLPTLVRGVVCTLFVAVMAGQPTVATELEGVHFADQVRTAEVTMRLSCVGLLRYKVFIKAYVAALYLGEGAADGDVLADVPKRLELSYFWSISGADFGKAGDQILVQNVDAQTFAVLRSRLDQINAWYRDVKPGDRYALTYIPGVGTELALNGQRIGVIEGADFAAAYFRIWLGDHPIDARLRDQLLGCAQDSARAHNQATLGIPPLLISSQSR